MQKLADKKATQFQQVFLNRQLHVLFEMENDNHDGIIDGLTSNYIRVYAKGNKAMQGKILKVHLEKPYNDGVWGKFVD